MHTSFHLIIIRIYFMNLPVARAWPGILKLFVFSQIHTREKSWITPKITISTMIWIMMTLIANSSLCRRVNLPWRALCKCPGDIHRFACIQSFDFWANDINRCASLNWDAPRRFLPSIDSIASLASSNLAYSIKAYPFTNPLRRSRLTWMFLTSPKSANLSATSSSCASSWTPIQRMRNIFCKCFAQVIFCFTCHEYDVTFYGTCGTTPFPTVNRLEITGLKIANVCLWID